MSKPEWKLIGDYPITEYQCGARAGERVRVRHDIVIRDQNGKPTGKIYHAGEIWMILSGSSEPPVDIWLRQEDGERHTWSDDLDFWKWFERVAESAS